MLKKYFIMAITAIFALVACSEKFDEPGIQPAGSDNVHTLSVGIEAGTYTPAEGGTKASMEAVIRVNWTKDDEVSVVNATTKKILGGCLKATDSGVSVTFEGTVTGTINQNDKLYYIYPRLTQNENEGDFGQTGYDQKLSDQKYDATKPNEVCFYGYAEDVAGTVTISKKIQFNLVTAYAHLNMSNLPAKGAPLTGIDISNVNEGFTWKLSSETLTAEPYAGSNGISVTCTNNNITPSGNAVVRFALPASGASQQAREITVNKAYKNDGYTVKELEKASYHNQLYSTWENNVKVTSQGDKTKVDITTSEGSTDVAEGVIPVAEAFNDTKPTEIGIGGVGTVTFDATATAKIKSNANAESSTNVFFKVEDVTNDTDVQKKNIVYEVTMKTVDGEGVEVFSEEKAEGEATVQVPLGDNVLEVTEVKLLDAEGQPIEGGVVGSSITFDPSSRILTFKVVHFSKYAITYTERTQPIPAVAQIGERNYETLSSAVAAAQNGNTIKLLCDCMDAEGIIVPEGKNFTLDFGGHTYKVTKDLAGSTGTKNQCFQLLKGSTLVFQNGKITTSCAKLGINSYSDLILKDVTVDMSQTSATDDQIVCLQTCNGNTSLQGNTNLIAKEDRLAILALYWPNAYGDINVELNTTGEVKGLMAYGSYQVQDLSTVAQHSHVAIKNGKYDVTFDMDELDNYDFKIYGGVFKASPDTEYLAPNHEVVTNTDSETSASYPYKVQQKPYVAMIGENGYFSLADALVAVKNNETIVMHQNDVLTKGLTISLENNEAFTLDLNGKTVSIAETGFDFAANGTNDVLRYGVPARFAIVVNGVGSMTICDNSTGESGRLETKNNSYGTTKTILVDGNAIVNVNSGTIAADYAAFYVVGHTEKTAAPANAPKPTLNVNGGKILGQMVGIGIKGNTATLKVTGGEIIANEYTGVSTNGTQDWYDGGKFAIEITGGLIKSGEGAAMYLPAEGPTVITGGTIEGADGIVVKGGSLSISGNTIVKATGSFGQAASASSGYTDTGSAIYVEDTYENHAPIVNISGGKFSSKNNKAVEYYTTKADDAKDKGKLTVYAGLYDDDSAKGYLADGKTVIDNTDETTVSNYPCAVVPLANEVQVAPDLEITSVDEESPLTQDQQTAAETTVDNAIKDMAANTEVANLPPTTKESNVDAVESGVVGTGQSVGINVEFTGTKVSVETGTEDGTTVTLKELTFDVTPYVVEKVTINEQETSVAVKKIENEQIKAPMTFRLPIPSDVKDNYAQVKHYVDETTTEDMGFKEIKSTTGNEDKTYKYIEITTTSFSKFEAILTTVSVPTTLLLYYYAGNATKVEGDSATPSEFQSAQAGNKNAIAFVDKAYANWASGQTNVVVDYSVGTNGHYYECPKFVLTDLEDFYTPVDFHVVNGSYTRENTGNLNTVCLPFELSSADVNNGQIGVFHSTDMYDGSNFKENGNVYFNVVGNVNPGTPCIIACDENDAGWNINLAGKTVAANPNNVNALKGSYVEETIGAGVYKVDSNGEKFGKTTKNEETVVPFRAYLDLKHGNGMETEVKDLNIEWADDATDIENVRVASDSKVIYDLTGRMVNNPVKGGLYIINGKKVIFK